jgi:uncharacterized protein (TIGR02996 family)
VSDEAAFLAAIQAAPADATTRLVYADWLEERNDPRAEFLRLQHQLAVILDRLQHVRGGLESAWVRAVEVRRDVVVHEIFPGSRPKVIKLIRLSSGMSLEQVRALLARLPAVVLRELPLVQAERLRDEFAEVSTVTIEPPFGSAPLAEPDHAPDSAM